MTAPPPDAQARAEGCECVGYTIRTDYGTGVEHDVDRSSCPIHGTCDPYDEVCGGPGGPCRNHGGEVDAQVRAACLANWPEAESMAYHPNCCRFPKSCSVPEPPIVTAQPPDTQARAEAGLSAEKDGER